MLNGLRITGLLFAGFAVLGLVLHAVNGIAGALKEGGVAQAMVGLAELMMATLCLWLTARVWTRYLAIIAFMGALKVILFGLIGGTIGTPPFTPVPRLEAALVAGYLIACGLLTVRFISRMPTRVERTALILVLLTTAAQFAIGTWLPGLFIGVGGLLASRLWTSLARTESAQNRSVAGS